jgi:hypothetical protein
MTLQFPFMLFHVVLEISFSVHVVMAKVFLVECLVRLHLGNHAVSQEQVPVLRAPQESRNGTRQTVSVSHRFKRKHTRLPFALRGQNLRKIKKQWISWLSPIFFFFFFFFFFCEEKSSPERAKTCTCRGPPVASTFSVHGRLPEKSQEEKRSSSEEATLWDTASPKNCSYYRTSRCTRCTYFERASSGKEIFCFSHFLTFSATHVFICKKTNPNSETERPVRPDTQTVECPSAQIFPLHS